ncbi:ATP-binding protein [Emticicia fluvialis]|uniref:ATP-binding protein n=1 Tax=Emticicia fluvialis TaxID=2974474 RepID=UPI002165F8DD|nr:ATP-binding protein [Emticicia fluvialis]
MKIRTGTPVEGDDFFGREIELPYIWRMIQSNNFIFPSPRRVGKTSFALRLLEKAEVDGWQTISLNLEQCTNEKTFVENFINALQKNSRGWQKVKDKGNNLIEFISKIKPDLKVAGVEVSLNWQENKEDVFSKLSDLLNHDEPTLIFFDEITVLLSIMIKQENGHETVTNFLHWLRSQRIKPGSKIRWIFCSSVGIENFTAIHKLSKATNDLKEHDLESFDEPTSRAMLKKLAGDNNIELNDEVIRAIIKKLGYCLPFFLQLMAEKIDFLNKVQKKPVDLLIVDKAYNILIEESHFNTWVERLEEQYGDLCDQATIMLMHICSERTGSRRENLRNKIAENVTDIEKVDRILAMLLSMLINDGYLMEENNLYVFRSPLLRDFWFKRFVK